MISDIGVVLYVFVYVRPTPKKSIRFNFFTKNLKRIGRQG